MAQVFSCEFYEIFKKTILQNISGRLLLFLLIFKKAWGLQKHANYFNMLIFKYTILKNLNLY